MQEDTLVSEINYPIKSSVTSITRTIYIYSYAFDIVVQSCNFLFICSNEKRRSVSALQ